MLSEAEYRLRRLRLAAQIRRLLSLPAWSNLRGDDVIAATISLDGETRARATELFCQLRELEDEALSAGVTTPLQAAGAWGYDAGEDEEEGA